MKKTLSILLTSVGLLALAQEAPSARFVRLGHPELRTVAQKVVKTGSLVAPAEVEICSKIGGRLLQLQLEDGTPVEEGVRVKKGQRLALVEDREYKAAVSAAKAGVQSAEATLADATREYDRAKALFADGTATAQERDNAQANFERAVAAVASANAQLETAQISLDETSIVAPMNGIISARAVDPGALLSPGTRIVTLTETDRLRFQIYVPTTYFGSLRQAGVRMDVEVDAYPGECIDIPVTRVYPVADNATRTVLVEAEIDNTEGRYLPGMFAVGTLNLNRRDNVLTVPYDCIVRNMTFNYVYVHQNGIVHAIDVKLGVRQDDVIEVTEGLQQTDEIVLVGQHRLTDGAAVKTESSAQ